MKTKEELAQRMAEFLGWERHKVGICFLWVIPNNNPFLLSVKEFCDYFYSPNGFMAVWNKLDEKFDIPIIDHWESKKDSRGCRIYGGNCGEGSEAYGSDRYTSFYRAVDELMETLA